MQSRFGKRESATSLSLHTGIFKTDILTSIRVAQSSGFEGVELQIDELERYLDSGRTCEDILAAAEGLRITMLDALLSVECSDPYFRLALAQRCDRLTQIAEQLDCPFIQVVPLDNYALINRAQMRRTLRESLDTLAAIVSSRNIRLALEVVCFSPFPTLGEAVEIVEEIRPDRIGLVLDTWHLWVSGVSWDDIADLDPSSIACVHLADSGPRTGKKWRDEDRAALPGQGIVPLGEAINAIRETGFNEVWTVEAFGDRFDGWEPETLARALFDSASHCLAEARKSGRDQ